jgi:carbon storage regulator CsrA
VIAEGISVTVVSVRGGTVRLGITAPRAVSVDRQEVRDRVATPPPAAR